MSSLLRALMNQATSVPAPPSDIITDGLVFRLNGMNQGSDPNSWIDEIGGMVFNYQPNAKKLPNGAQFDGSKQSYLICDSPKELFRTAGTTIEVCMDPTTWFNKIVFSQSQLDNKRNWAIGLYQDSTGGHKRFVNGNKTASTPYLPCWQALQNTPLTFSFTESDGLHDGKNMTFKSTDYWTGESSKNIITVGCNAKGIALNFIGKIYEIRIYNRILSTEERYFNAAHDVKVYNPGVLL